MAQSGGRKRLEDVRLTVVQAVIRRCCMDCGSRYIRRGYTCGLPYNKRHLYTSTYRKTRTGAVYKLKWRIEQPRVFKIKMALN